MLNDRGLVSVIVPVYKVEKYIHKCVYSILNQTYRNLEIILVDDGSPDNCPAICDEYAKKDNRVKVIHQKNHGLSGARNAGLDVATGDYIAFVDSDDWIEENTIEVSVRGMKNTDVNIVWFGTRRLTTSGSVYTKLKTAMTYEKIFQYYMDGGFVASVCDKLYRRAVWQNTRFTIGMLYEDSYVFADIFKQYGGSILTISDALYNYRRNEGHGSITDTIDKNPEEPYYFWKWMNNVSLMLKSVSHSTYEKYIVIAIKRALKSYIVNMATHCLSEQRFREIQDFLKQQYKNRTMLNFEYRLYYFSWKHWNLFNWIKSIDYVYKYRGYRGKKHE